MNKPSVFDALANKPQPKKRKKKHGRKKPLCWPRDIVNQKHSLADLIDAKLGQWIDDEYDAGKDW